MKVLKIFLGEGHFRHTVADVEVNSQPCFLGACQACNEAQAVAFRAGCIAQGVLHNNMNFGNFCNFGWQLFSSVFILHFHGLFTAEGPFLLARNLSSQLSDLIRL